MTQALNKLSSIQLFTALFVFPVCLTSLIMLTHKSYKQKQLLDSLPLLCCALNSSFIWMSMSVYSASQFYYFITGYSPFGRTFNGLKSDELGIFLSYAINVEPLSLFLYAWRFL